MRKFVTVISILEHIQYLIVNRDCVVIPGFGAFVSRYVPASFNDDGTLIVPPSRELGFNSTLSHDDGTLTGSITRREGVSYECARIAVEQEVELMHRRLHHERNLNLSRIGLLTLTDYGTVEFTPEKESPLVALPFKGFPLLNLEPIMRISANTETEEPIILDMESGNARGKRRRNFAIATLKYAASAAVLVGVCLTMLTPISPQNVDFASLQPIIPTETTVSTTETQNPDKQIFIPKPDPAEATAEVKNDTDKYYVIVASSTTLKEAKKYVRMHSSEKYPLQILHNEGRYRVFAASGNDFGEMSDFRTSDSEFVAANPNAWVYTLR